MIFINYRKVDSAPQADRLCSELKKEFGDTAVFRDESGIEGGEVWDAKILKALTDCRVLLVLVGRQWRTVQQQGGDFDGWLRLQMKERDWVWREIRYALDNHKWIIPIEVGNGKVPDEDWLANIGLAELAKRQPVTLREGRDWEWDLAEIVRLIREKLPEPTDALDVILTNASRQGLRDWDPELVGEPGPDTAGVAAKRTARPPRYIEPHLGRLRPEI